MSRIEKNKLNFTVALIAEFAATYQIKQKQAFNYLNRFKGLVFLQKHYENITRITHTKKYKKLKSYEQEEIYIPFKHFEKEIKSAIKFWRKVL